MQEDNFLLFRQFNTEILSRIWDKAKNADLDGLTEEETRIAKAMIEHEEEYSSYFEFPELSEPSEDDNDDAPNPLMHIYTHSIIDYQLNTRNPMEVYQFYNAMINKKVSRHDTFHLITAIFSPFIYDIMKHNRPFNEDKYISILKKYKNKKPEKIYSGLEKDLQYIFDE